MARENRNNRKDKRFGRTRMIADRLLDVGVEVGCPGWVEDSDFRQVKHFALKMFRTFGEMVTQVPIVSGDNVADYYYAQTAQDEWFWREDFPNCRPPFDRFFIEFNRPAIFRDASGIRLFDVHFPTQWGWIIECLDAAKMPRNVPDDFPLGDQFVALLNLPEVESIVRCTSILVQDGAFVPGFQVFYLPIDAKGRVLAEPIILSAFGRGIDDERMREKSQFLHVALLAISFMNCKGVTVPVIEPDRQLNRARRKAGMKPFLRYHVIDIEPMKRVLSTEGRIDDVGLKRALHICRGHFATYSEERPLFGRVSGTFWVPAHVRGSAKHGVIVSDYNVNPPRPDSYHGDRP